MRRRALLAASSMMGGGKQVNTITLKPYVKSRMLWADYYAQYPVKSNITIQVATNGITGKGDIPIYENIQEGTTNTEIDIMPESNEITVTSINPQEDDTYIYEVVVEY